MLGSPRLAGCSRCSRRPPSPYLPCAAPRAGRRGGMARRMHRRRQDAGLPRGAAAVPAHSQPGRSLAGRASGAPRGRSQGAGPDDHPASARPQPHRGGPDQGRQRRRRAAADPDLHQYRLLRLDDHQRQVRRRDAQRQGPQGHRAGPRQEAGRDVAAAARLRPRVRQGEAVSGLADQRVTVFGRSCPRIPAFARTVTRNPDGLRPIARASARGHAQPSRVPSRRSTAITRAIAMVFFSSIIMWPLPRMPTIGEADERRSCTPACRDRAPCSDRRGRGTTPPTTMTETGHLGEVRELARRLLLQPATHEFGPSAFSCRTNSSLRVSRHRRIVGERHLAEAGALDVAGRPRTTPARRPSAPRAPADRSARPRRWHFTRSGRWSATGQANAPDCECDQQDRRADLFQQRDERRRVDLLLLGEARDRDGLRGIELIEGHVAGLAGARPLGVQLRLRPQRIALGRDEALLDLVEPRRSAPCRNLVPVRRAAARRPGRRRRPRSRGARSTAPSLRGRRACR